MRRRLPLRPLLVGALALGALLTPGALATPGPDTEVTVGSNDTIFSQNKQNEPWVAVNPVNPNVLAAGANDNIDMEACNAGADDTCPFTPGVGLSGISFSFDGGSTWTQPTYTGYSARFGIRNSCLGAPGADPGCTPDPNGPIGTLPWYFENDLVSNGDPALAFGPRLGRNGLFSWRNGIRLYYTNLTVPFPGTADEFAGFVAIAVSRTDDVKAAAAGKKNAWMQPVIVSRQNEALFSDKEAVWADNAETSPFFGTVYVCNAAFRAAVSSSPNAAPDPIMVAVSTDGGDTWRQRQITQAANNITGNGRQGCVVRTDSHGVVYVFYRGGEYGPKDQPPIADAAILMARSFDRGETWEVPRVVAFTNGCGRFDPNQGRLTFDGIAGARTNIGPTADIANGAPSGKSAPDTIAIGWCDGPTPTDIGGANEEALVQLSSDGGNTWTSPVNAADPAQRPDFPWVALAPDGSDVYLTYMGFVQPWQSTTANPRTMKGVVRHASVTGTRLGQFSTVHEGVPGDARGSSANSLVAEFLGDYNYVAATNDFAYAVWNDVRNASSCAALDTFRQNLATGVTPNPRPAPQLQCAPTFGNSDIFGTKVDDPS